MRLALIFWWFVAIGYSANTIGPFESYEQCEAMRKQVERYGQVTFPCWSANEPTRRR